MNPLDPPPAQDADPDAAPAAKVPPPGLAARAPRPPAIRMRRGVVQAVALGGVLLVSGSLAWAFVVQPELRDSARARKAEGREEIARGPVRPAEAITEQPASYDRLPEPRIGGEDRPPSPDDARPAPVRPTAYRGRPPAPPARPTGPAPGDLAARSGLFFADAGARSAGEGAAPEEAPAADTRAGLTAPASPYVLQAGSIVPAALLTAVDTARAGPVVAVLTQNVYDTVSGRHLLAPQGSRLIGRSGGDSAWGDRRAFVTWDRLILPNGKSVDLPGEAAVDAQGAVGVPGEADRRLLPLLAGVLLGGAVTTLGQIARDGDDGGGVLGDAGDAASIEGARVGGRLVDRELEVRPSIRVRAGAAVQVLLTRDLVLERYRP